MKPMREAGILVEEEIKRIFSVLPIIVGVNTQLLKELQTDHQAIQVTFEKFCPFLKTYSEYIANQMTSLNEINRLRSEKQFNSFCKVICSTIIILILVRKSSNFLKVNNFTSAISSWNPHKEYHYWEIVLEIPIQSRYYLVSAYQ
jgi:hypothetical protein